MELTYTYYIVDGKTGALIFSPRGLLQLLLPVSQQQIIRWIRNNYPQAGYDQNKAPSLKKRLERYFQGNRVSFAVNLDWGQCTAFQKRVYEGLMRVPFGSTCSYRELAEAVGVAGGARAVGTALKNNPIPVIIPCHRVIRSDGSLGGFSSGIEWKKRLLSLENYDFVKEE